MKHVLFVGKQNNCRSLLAEAILKDKLVRENLSERIHVNSAGTFQWQNKDAADKTITAVLEEHGLPTEGLHPKQLERHNLDSADYIISLDREVLKDLEKLARSSSHRSHYFLLLELFHSYTLDVPNPYYTKDFDEAYRLIDEGCKALLNKIKETS
ncbi:low molecular weight phosphotyrosine protein phosphatase [Jeotgalibacillus sp. ET6]|uniref:arsenate reductase/protein-tyrosine-phosphatase family protein n=1 Tax=Jeotgalibacillus sp. ET6 TaxID=3037260 RepID=UPI0024181AEC|nr:low molecular weight phosphotyrosine protein phosphatase [Jeotgalibacillus sp. ET6]MDG5473315.1 low molecular weight phosphotyrosine protein phosphatase [Jeotgalibacillus sp. ET6]